MAIQYGKTVIMKIQIAMFFFLALSAEASMPTAPFPPLKDSELVKLDSKTITFTNHQMTVPMTIIPDASGGKIAKPLPLGYWDVGTDLHDVTAPSEFIVVAEVTNVTMFAIINDRGINNEPHSSGAWYEVDCAVVSEVDGNCPFKTFRFVTCLAIGCPDMPYFKTRHFRFGFNKTGDNWTIVSQQLVCPLPPYQKDDHMTARMLRDNPPDAARMDWFKKVVDDHYAAIKAQGYGREVFSVSLEKNRYFVIASTRVAHLDNVSFLNYGVAVQIQVYDWQTGLPLIDDGFELDVNLREYLRIYEQVKGSVPEVTNAPEDKQFVLSDVICDELPSLQFPPNKIREFGRKGIELGADATDDERFEWLVTFLHSSGSRWLEGNDYDVFHLDKVANSYLRDTRSIESFTNQNSSTIEIKDQVLLSIDGNKLQLGTNATIIAHPNTLYTVVSNSITEDAYSHERLKQFLGPLINVKPRKMRERE